ncbi:PLC-like phosphodiesterase, TIM beta/alpha-barrel domain [Pseudocohnilembus persalinus]|uniref:PLC-like phosphodiesterase, TIM beta/alpha-barrel domain n=1 Tax=Pseudocohnilembus persalinus TaxID=266149 RepID=A0A0V0QHQ3_PSEPJ|nr:PLC-like phosphodiesterase, TIM beta/alpha-barrel domain [Pseudocohnilembus persalinus]|eukprot:KRX01785.1 PLC-like phosphodiesterase, TIM beta/alpha-barrel domain [Pseudocohnilembus persalinus]
MTKLQSNLSQNNLCIVQSYQKQQYDNQQNVEIQQLENEKNQTAQVLQKNDKTILISYRNLQSVKDKLQTSYSDQQLQSDELLIKYQNIYKQNDQLQQKNQELKQQNDKLYEKYNNLDMKYRQLYYGEKIDISTYDGLYNQNSNTFIEYYNSQLNLELTQITAKCSHNSFDIGRIQDQLTFNETHSYQGGSQMLEFDIFPQNNTDELFNPQQEYIFYTFHGIPKSLDECLTFNGQLQDIATYHENNSQHLPIFVTLNVKQWIIEEYTLDTQTFYESLEQSILNVFDQQDLYIPNNLLNGESNLFSSIQKNGFPIVSELLGKIIFIVDSSYQQDEKAEFTKFIQYYLEYGLETKLMFNTLDTRIIQNGKYDSIQEFMNETNNYNLIFINIKQNYKKDLYPEQYKENGPQFCLY